MVKITFMGAGSTVFAKNVLGDCMLSPPLRDARLALYDVDGVRLEESRRMLDVLNANINQGRARITAHLGPEGRRAALDGATYVVNAIQVGGYEPCTVTDFEVPKRYGLRQTIGDTLGIGGIFRALRTIPVMLEFAEDMQAVCPDAWFLNYTNPMSMLTAAMIRGGGIKTVGLCHSVQVCAEGILGQLDMLPLVERLRWKIAGINHQAWLLEVKDGDEDLYPEIKRRAADRLAAARRPGGVKHADMVRHALMLHFGYYITESSEHNAEYVPYFIKSRFPELIEEFHIPLDEYPRRCVAQIENWKQLGARLARDPHLSHQRTHEYGSHIMEAIQTGVPILIGGNVMNAGLVTNLPAKACVEVPCVVDRNGVQPTFVGDLPEGCAGLNRAMINPQLLAVEAALTRNRDLVYQAAMLDPHTAAELPLDSIRQLCDDLIAAHGKWLPPFRNPPAAAPWSKARVAAGLSPFVNAWRVSAPSGIASVRDARAVSLSQDHGWRPVGGDRRERDFVSIHDLYPQGAGVVYFAVRVSVERTGDWDILLGHDGGASLFVDGRQVYCDPQCSNPARSDRARIPVRLMAGTREVLVAFDTAGGQGWGIFLRFRYTAAAGEPFFPKPVA